ncbi:thiamine pyrophosphokinase-related protein [Aspergillus heterothallicus]
MTKLKTYLDIVQECDNFPYPTDNPTQYKTHLEKYYAFKVANYADQTLGHVPGHIIQSFTFPTGWIVNHEARELILAPPLTTTETESTARAKRTALMQSTLNQMSTCTTRPEFLSLAKQWRNETFPIVAKTQPTGEQTPVLLLEIERCASALFGILTSGVQLTCYVRDSASGALRIWIARRSRAKQTYPGMLDSAAAGGLESGMDPLEGVVREAVEEASLDERVVRGGVRGCGVLSYFHVKAPLVKGGDEVGYLQPEIEYVYELELMEGVEPRPGDDEVEEFFLWGVDEVKAALLRGEFKPNSAIVVVDFLIRHGVVTAENERDYCEIVWRLHRRL